jgi:hypothetical protein
MSLRHQPSRTDTSGAYTRTILPPRPRAEAASAPVRVCAWARRGLGGDELRVRAWLWRRLGVGAAAGSYQ